MAEDSVQDGTFYHLLTQEEMNVQFDGTTLFLTYYSGLGKPRGKRILDLNLVSSDEISDLFKYYRRKES